MLDAINRPQHLFDHAIEIGLTGFAITDHECLSAHVQIMEIRDKMKAEGKLPENFTISFGNEAYLVDELEMNIKYYHWLLMAKNAHGHKLLRILSTQAWDNSYYDRGMERVPLTKKQVEEIMERENGKGDLIVTSACLGGELGANALAIKAIEEGRIQDSFLFGKVEGLPEDLINRHKKNMVDYVLWNQRVFGKDNFYIELAPNDKDEQRYSNRMLYNLAKSMDVKVIFATDAHYLTKEDQAIHRAFLNSKDGEREVDDFYSTAYLMSTEEVWSYMKLDFTASQFNEMVENLDLIRSQIEEYSLFKEQEIPQVKVQVPEIMHPQVDEKWNWIIELSQSELDQDQHWLRVCLNELYKRGKWDDERYFESLNNEAEVIIKVSERMGQPMSAYYNTARRLIEIMWSDGDSLVGASRGSALAFVSNWLLDITQIDPIPYEIPYWRHLSADRPELPDVDIDAEGFKRESIIQAMRDYFGEDRVLNIATYGTEGTKSAIATACRGLGIDNDISLYLSSMVPNERGFDWSLKDMVEGNPGKGRFPVRSFVEEVNSHEKLLETAMAIEGMITKRGSHAAGVYFFNHDYTDINASMKTPSGLKVTQWDMHESDMLGGLKFDFLSIEALDKIRATMELLIDDGHMERKETLKATYDHYLHPDILDYNPKLWEPSWTGEVLDLFQFQTPVGGEAIRQGKPTNVFEGAALNSLMRLMPMADGTVPTEKFVKFKENINLWYEEMERAGVPGEEVKVLEKHYLKSHGVPNTQEELMLLLMDEKTCHFTQTEANMARKIIGKKLMEKIPMLKQKIFDDAVCTKETVQYIWDTAISVQLGYSFSLPHTVAYTVIALQELNLYNKFHPIYWNTACLIVNAGGEDGTTDYAKIAVAIGNIQKNGVTVLPVDINQSGLNFTPSPEDNAIFFGFKALSGVGEEMAHNIIDNRPFSSLLDFQEKVKGDVSAMVSLVKSGAFDGISARETRRMIMYDYLSSQVGIKKKITTANIPKLKEHGLIPEEQHYNLAIYEFNRYLKFINEKRKKAPSLILDERAQAFYLGRDFNPDLLDYKGKNVTIAVKDWERIYNKEIIPLKDWLAANKEELIHKFFLCDLLDMMEKYATGSISKWEMDSMSFYYHEHELINVNRERYGIVRFSDLGEDAEVDYFFNGFGRQIPIFKTVSIIGTIIGKNAVKGSIDLLTPEGDVILVKMNKDKFSHYNKQISEVQSDGKKKVIEKSWFQRGNLMMVHGIRRKQQFLPKTYKHTPFKSLYLINKVKDNGELELISSRA